MNGERSAVLHWLDPVYPDQFQGASWGVPWPQGSLPGNTKFVLKNRNGTLFPHDSWPLAYWPDGSIKWSAHAAGTEVNAEAGLEVHAADTDVRDIPDGTVRVLDEAQHIRVDTGVMEYVLKKQGSCLIESAVKDGVQLLSHVVLNAVHKSTDDSLDAAEARRTATYSQIKKVSLEQAGSSRAVVRFDGIHVSPNEALHWLPFCVRLYFYSGSERVRIIHSFEYDADEYRDFIAGLGLSFSVPLRDEAQDRHIRFAGEDRGLFAEAVKGMTGLRRFPGEKTVQAQFDGTATVPLEDLPDTVSRRMHLIPSFGDYSLCQQSCDSFYIKKRTAAPYGWITADRGGRAAGLGYVGGISGGAVFGIRDFWKSFPSQLDIRNAAGAEAEVSMWLWSPEAAPMDLRFYHDGLGQDSYEEQLEGLEITYEDYEPEFGRPSGVARTSELFIHPVPCTPSRDTLADMALMQNNPPQPVCDPVRYNETRVFGGLCGLPDYSNPRSTAIEKELDWYFDFYQGEIERRRWYGFWDYGDVMHSYDPYRHVWKYDVGGYAWDNSELSTDLWLWYYFLRSGKSQAFRMAEAMTRHTGEVDVHHSGPFAPFGSRHNVRHWGCSAKQLRISTAINRRFYYYLTADERVGDLMRAQVEGCRALERIQAGRKIIPLMEVKPPANTPGKAYTDFGTDWGAIASAWVTEWERTGDPAILKRLTNSMKSIADQPNGFFSGASLLNLDSGSFDTVNHDSILVSHLSAVFGLFEICVELIQLIDMPEFKKAWLDYCRLYNEDVEVQEKELGERLRGISLLQGHSRLSAYAAAMLKDEKLVRLAWEKFYLDEFDAGSMMATRTLYGPDVLRETVESPHISTNHCAQWCLAAMQCLQLLGSPLDSE